LQQKGRRPKPTPLHLLSTKQKEKLDLAAELFRPLLPRNRANLESQAVKAERMATLGLTESLSRKRVRLLLKNTKSDRIKM
jgi:hypothetical protein